MKKRTKSKQRRQPRSPRSTRRRRQSPVDQVFDLRCQIRDGVLEAIRGAISATARQLVEDEVVALVGEPWSKRGDSPLRRNGRTQTTMLLDGEPHLLDRARVRDQEEGSEYPLQTLRALRNRDAMDEEVKARVMLGITTTAASASCFSA